MKIILIILMSVLMFTSSHNVCAGEEIDKTIDVPATGSLYIENTRGTVIVRGWDKNQIAIRGEIDNAAEKIIFKNKHDKSLIKIKVPRNHHQGDSSEITVFMPHNVLLGFKGIDTSFDISGLKQGIEGHTIKGDLNIEQVQLKINVSSISGDITIRESSGSTQIESVNGDISLSGLFTKANIKSMSGEIAAKFKGVQELKIKNFSGDTDISGKINDDARVQLSSVSGNIKLHTIDELNADCNIESQFGGDIENNVTDDKPKISMMKAKVLNFVTGNGSAKVSVHTLSGTILIEK